MIASKVSVSPETRAKLDNHVLSPVKKRELRECMIKDRIRNAVGHLCTKQELVAAAGYNPEATSSDYGKGMSLINSMVKRKIISHDNSNQFRKVWTVIEDAKKAPKVSPTPAEVAAELVVELKDFKNLTSIELVEMAKEFAWQNNSDSLREFIDYARNAIK